jgi:dolichol-phosphate mannosyltransferase
MDEVASGDRVRRSLVGTDAGLRSLYQNRFSEADRRSKDRVWSVVVGDFLQRWIRPEDAVLDIGCGYGEFLNHVRSARRVGVDMNPDSAAALEAGVEFHHGDVRDLSFLPDASVDVAFTSNLMEHLPSKGDVEAMVGEARRVLRPGGHFIALGPNLRFLTGAYWDFWDHSTPITDRSLVELLENLDLAVVDCHPKFLPYTTRSSLPKALWLVRAYLRFPVAWRVLGRQFLIRARKP